MICCSRLARCPISTPLGFSVCMQSIEIRHLANERASHDDATFAHDLNFVFNLLGLSNCYECFLVDSD